MERGTGNGMSKSLLEDAGEKFSASNATLSIICGNTRKVDVSTLTQGDRKFFSVLMLAWGLIADVDIESEKYRWMGGIRINFYAFLRVFRLRKYQGRVHFVPAPGYESHGEPATTKIEPCEVKTNDSEGTRGYQGPTISFKSSDWRSIEGPFIFLWTHNVPWGSDVTIPAPDAKFSDGYIDVVIVKECAKPTLASLLANVSNGSHVKYPCAMYLKVKALQLEPGQRVNEPEKGGIIDVDGEVLARGSGTYLNGKSTDLMDYGTPIKVTVDQGLATVFAPIAATECKPSF
ncbi:sphingosine kinase 2-like isoform X2 [Wolffia australiana]